MKKEKQGAGFKGKEMKGRPVMRMDISEGGL